MPVVALTGAAGLVGGICRDHWAREPPVFASGSGDGPFHLRLLDIAPLPPRCACRSGRWRRERALVRESAARDWATERPYAPRSLTRERVRTLEKKGCERGSVPGEQE
jgi:hypothetical protein